MHYQVRYCRYYLLLVSVKYLSRFVKIRNPTCCTLFVTGFSGVVGQLFECAWQFKQAIYKMVGTVLEFLVLFALPLAAMFYSLLLFAVSDDHDD